MNRDIFRASKIAVFGTQLILNTTAAIPRIRLPGVSLVLVVSNIDLTIDSLIMKPATFLDASIKEPTLNISNDYRYLKTGYYVSLHAEVLGNPVIPSRKYHRFKQDTSSTA